MNFLSTVTKVAVVFSLILVSCKPAETTQEGSESIASKNVQEEVIRLIRNMPAEQNQEEVWVNEQLVDLGAEAVHVLSGMLIDPALGSDLQARYALNSLATYVTRPGATSDRRAFEAVLLSEIQSDHSLEVKSFLIEQLRLVASNSSIPVMESFLNSERLYNDALRVLLTLDSPMVVTSIRQSLPASEGEIQIAMVKALGELRDRDSVAMIQEYAESDRWELSRISLFALSKIGQPGSSSLFEQGIDETTGFRKSEIISFYLGYADVLLNSGYPSESMEITDYFLNGEFPAHIKSSALEIRFDMEGAAISNELISIAGESEAILSKSALRLLNELEEESITESLIDGLEASAQSNTIYFIDALGERGDRSAVPVLENQIESSESEIRLAALNALYQIQGEIEPEVIIDVLEKAELDQEVQHLEDLLLQLNPNKVIPVVASSLQEASIKTKPILIDLLATYKVDEEKQSVIDEWNSENTEVNVAVVDYLGVSGDEEDAILLADRLGETISDEEQESIFEALASLDLNRTITETQRNQRFNDYYNNASILQKERLIHLIPYIDGTGPIEILESSLRHTNSKVRMAAIEVISSWNSPDIIPLFNAAVSNSSSESKMALINNFTQIMNGSNKSQSDKEQIVHELFSSIGENQYRIELLRGIAESDKLLALQIITEYLDYENEEIREASIHILSEIIEPYYSTESEELNGSNGVLAVLDEKVREEVINQILEARTNQIENEEDLQTEEPHFGTLFNGKDLDGWQVIGNQDAWGVEDGILFTDGAGSGWISSEGQYDNFIIELEYRVPVGGNSGLFLRAPHEGNPAYEGLEIQILDDYADQYADLKPWQFTGSIYFEQAVSKRVTKVAGEWQTLKVRAEGPIIQVTLNGEQIINANLIQYMKNAPNHPGLLKRSGYIGLQNHGDRVDFRNISISRID